MSSSIELERIKKRAPQLYQTLTSIKDKQLEDYLRNDLRSILRSNQKYLELSIQALEKFLLRTSYYQKSSAAQIFEACSEFEEEPILQQIDHSSLLLDTETFLNNLLFTLSRQYQNKKTAISLQCSTVKNISDLSTSRGPSYVDTRFHSFKIFNKSRKQLKYGNFCCLPSPISLDTEFVETDLFLSKVFKQEIFETPEDCFIAKNNFIWHEISEFTGVRRYQIDERYTAYLMESYIQDVHNPVFELLFNSTLRDRFLSVYFELCQDSMYKNHISLFPEFFWMQEATKLVPASLKNTMLCVKGKAVAEWKPEIISDLLRNRKIYPNKFFSYLVRTLLPGITAIGGTSQQDYLDIFKTCLLEVNRQIPCLDESLLENISTNCYSKLGGVVLLEPSEELSNEIQNFDGTSTLVNKIQPFLESRVEDSVGKLSSAEYLKD